MATTEDYIQSILSGLKGLQGLDPKNNDVIQEIGLVLAVVDAEVGYLVDIASQDTME